MTFLLTFLRFLPGIGSLISTLTTKWLDTKAQMYAERMGVTKEVAVSMIQAEVTNNQTKVGWLNAVANSRFLQFIVGGFALPLIVHMNKAYVWDNIIHKFIWGTYGFTPPMTGYILDWGGVIIGGIFVTSTGMMAAGAFANRAMKQ